MREPAQEVSVGPAALIAARPEPSMVREQERHAALAALADDEKRLVFRALHQHFGLARIGLDDAEPAPPGRRIAGSAGQIAGDGVLLAELGEPRLERLLDDPPSRNGGENLPERRAVETERGGVIVAGRDQHRAALFDIAGDVLEIEQRQHAPPLVAVEDDEIELIELLLEQLAGREGDQR